MEHPVTTIVSVVVSIFIYTPLIIYHGREYYKSQHHIVYRARYSNITIYEIVLMGIKVVYGTFDTMIYLWMPNSPIYFIIDAINTFLAYFLIYSFVWRIWCISYDIIWIKRVINNQWKQIINSMNINETKDWYISNKHTFGNYKWVKWKLFGIAVFSASFYSITSLFGSLFNPQNLYITQIWASWPYTIPTFFLLIIYFKTPKFIDNFYVIREMKYMILLLFIDYCAFYFSLLYGVLMTDNNSIFIIGIIANWLIISSQFGVVMISTYWVNRKVNKIINKDRYKSISSIDIESISSISSISNSMNVELIEIQPKTQKNTTYKTQPVDLKKILRHSTGFETFFAHLCYEFSIESLLCIIECLQFQKFINRNGNNNKDKSDDKLLCNIIVIPDTVPLSQYISDGNNDFKTIAYKLYLKYIQNGAMYEVNISYEVRKKLNDLIGNYEIWNNNVQITNEELLHLFDPCCHELYQLMQDSYSRFQRTPQYHKLLSDLIFI